MTLKKINPIFHEDEEKEYYIATTDNLGNDIIYVSEIFKLTEFEILNLIKICLIDKRSKVIGEKILEVYRDSTYHKKEIAIKKLNMIGIKGNGDKTPTISTNSKKK